MALSDGAHMSTEEFSYFTLRRKETATEPATSLFGIACSRQIDSNTLLYRPPDVTRSTVQKAVVVVTDNPQSLGQLREKVSIVTSAWFAQRESLVISLRQKEGSKDQNLGLSLREMIHEFKYQTLVLFKALLLQPKTVEKSTSLKTTYMGLPLQIFGKGSMFGPYTPLQQLDLLADHGTKSYVVGSTNSLLLQQKDRYSDILINLDEDTINVLTPSLRNALALSVADRRWIDLLTQIINETWDEAHPQQPKTHGYMGSEEFIRLQFEEYLLALLACMQYHEELNSYTAGDPGHRSRAQLEAFNIEGDPALEFNVEFLNLWRNTSNYALFKRLTSDALLFSIVEPRHPCAGGLTIDDIQRRLSQQVADLHLDERVREGREALNRHLSTGQKKVSAAFNSFWADIESMREAQRKRNEERAGQSQRTSTEKSPSPPFSPSDSAPANSTGGWFSSRKPPAVDITQAQASVNAVSQRAGSYISSWSAWASEKRKEWQEKKTSPSPTPSIASPSTPTLPSVAEAVEADRGRRKSLQARRSEDSVALSRSGSRRKRWSNILLRRESGEFGAPHTGDGSESDVVYPRSPLSREPPVFGDGEPEPTKDESTKETTQTCPQKDDEKKPTEASKQPEDSAPTSQPPPENEADKTADNKTEVSSEKQQESTAPTTQ
ncbi:hypothetical protein ATERTT37_001641 [Aspergillus terreus]